MLNGRAHNHKLTGTWRVLVPLQHSVIILEDKMYYILEISLGKNIEDPIKITEPALLRTLTIDKEKIKPEEIEMVADAFKKQIKPILEYLINAKL